VSIYPSTRPTATLTIDICVQHGGHEALRRTGLSALSSSGDLFTVQGQHFALKKVKFHLDRIYLGVIY